MHHLRQAGVLVAGRSTPATPVALLATPRTARLFTTLAPHDRRHLTAVHGACVAAGLAPDVATAGLLHDIGKASLSGWPVNLVDRTLRVGLDRMTRGRLQSVRDVVPRWRLGLALAERHAEIGAARLAALGWSDAVVAAVRDHESTDSTGELATLRTIDDTTV